MKNFCDCDYGYGRGGLILAAFVAVAEVAAMYLFRDNKEEMMDEISHYKDESRYLRAELDKVREKYLAVEQELHETTLAFESYAYQHNENTTQEEQE